MRASASSDGIAMTSGDPRSPRYRFAEVELDPANYALHVDGEPRQCSRKAFELLLLLVRNAGRVLSRDEVMGALWPGGQIVSDEALAQLVFRTRAVLGAHGSVLKTLRGIGLRLDAPVMLVWPETTPPPVSESTEFGLEASSTPDAVADGKVGDGAASADPGDVGMLAVSAPVGQVPLVTALARNPAGSLPATTRRGHWTVAMRLAIVTLVLSLALLAWSVPRWLQPMSSSSEMLDEGYGLMRSDLRASNADSAGFIIEALANEASGERSRAMRVLETLHAADSTTPVPAIYLAIWSSGDGDGKAARLWLDQARTRVGPTPDLYYDLWLAYVAAATNEDPKATIDAAGALLSVRKGAWRMRLARAHLLEFRGMRASALHEISQIEVPRLGHRKRDLVIADRASMGDIAGAMALLDQIDADSDPVMYAFLRGRLAWSRGDFDAAHTEFLHVARAAYDHGRLDLYNRALQYAGAIDVTRGDDAAALANFDSARTALGGRNLFADIDLSLLLAGLHAEAGRTELMQRELERALATPLRSGDEAPALSARFAALRLRVPVARPPELEPVAAALWDAYLAWQQGQPDALRSALADAGQRGVDGTRLADEARWLQWQAGLPVSAASVIDPPYPPLSRLLLRRQIDRGRAAQDSLDRPGG